MVLEFHAEYPTLAQFLEKGLLNREMFFPSSSHHCDIEFPWKWKKFSIYQGKPVIDTDPVIGNHLGVNLPNLGAPNC